MRRYECCHTSSRALPGQQCVQRVGVVIAKHFRNPGAQHVSFINKMSTNCLTYSNLPGPGNNLPRAPIRRALSFLPALCPDGALPVQDHPCKDWPNIFHQNSSEVEKCTLGLNSVFYRTFFFSTRENQAMRCQIVFSLAEILTH